MKKKISLPLFTLDIELKNVDKNKIKLIKIDVEGWEKFVLNGAEDFFVNYKPIVMIEFTEENTFNAGYPVYDIYDKMLSYGYVWYRIVEGQLINEEKKIHYT